MLNNSITEQIFKKANNRFELVNIISKRARQLIEGEEPKIKITDVTTKVTTASVEYAKDKIYKI